MLWICHIILFVLSMLFNLKLWAGWSLWSCFYRKYMWVYKAALPKLKYYMFKFVHPAVSSSGECPCKHWTKGNVKLLGIYHVSELWVTWIFLKDKFFSTFVEGNLYGIFTAYWENVLLYYFNTFWFLNLRQDTNCT